MPTRAKPERKETRAKTLRRWKTREEARSREPRMEAEVEAEAGMRMRW